jgi:peptide/nickel transport system ATP-binding protein
MSRVVTSEPVLCIDRLRVALPPGGDRPFAVQDVSLGILPGQTLCVVGESGSGKSVMATAVMGLLAKELKPMAGRVALKGESLLDAAPARLRELRGRSMGMVFQEPMTALNPVMRCGEQIDELLRAHTDWPAAERRQRVLEMLDHVRLPDPERMYASYPHQLSGGQRQRVVIAIALACGPDLLIADEPTTALDVTLQREVLDLIDELVREDGMALLLISHDLGVMADRVQRLLVMYGGTVAESGPTAEVFARRWHPYTRGLHAARPRLGIPRGTRLATIPGRVPELADLPAGCPFAERCPRVVDACRVALPAADEVAPGHRVRCLRPGDEAEPVAAKEAAA